MNKTILIRYLFLLILLGLVRSTYQTIYSCNASATCGCSTNSATVTRIVGGEAASSATWGWAVSIRMGTGGLCGGSIISSSWVITAAHCVDGFTASQFTIYAGSLNRWTGTQSRSVSQVVAHPQYNSFTYVNDIALLKLSSPLTMTDPYISSICLPSVSAATLSAGEWPSVGTNVVAVGWGRLNESGSLPTTLQQVTVQTVSYLASTCTPTMVDWRIQFCAGVSGGGKDTCQGDSGGPLMMFSSSNQWILVGLTSSGIGCARASYSGMYTRVAAFQEWISSTTVATETPGPITTYASMSSTTVSMSSTTTSMSSTSTSLSSTDATTSSMRNITTTRSSSTFGPITLNASTVSTSVLNIFFILFSSLSLTYIG